MPPMNPPPFPFDSSGMRPESVFTFMRVCRNISTTVALLAALAVAIPSFGQQADKGNAVPESKTNEKLSLPETIELLKSQGKTEEATFLTQQKERTERYTSNFPNQNWGVVFGKLVVSNSDDPHLADAQMDIHTSGWFLSDLSDIDKPLEVRMWGHRPYQIIHPGPQGATANVGDLVLEPFPSNELATVRAELKFEGKVDPKAVVINVVMQHPPVNHLSGGTNGNIPRPDKEGISLGPNFRINRSGLSPIPHYVTIKAPGHLPFFQQFDLESGKATDLGVLNIATSPAFEIELAIADGLDFSKSERRKLTVYAGDLFPTNPAGKNWQAGNLRFQEKNDAFVFFCGLASLVITDLGEGKLEDHLQPVHSQPPQRDRFEPTPVSDGHVYLITHTMKRIWKHATLMKVQMRPYGEQDSQ